MIARPLRLEGRICSMSYWVRCVKSYWTAGNAEKATKISKNPTHAFLIVRLACYSSIRNFRLGRARWWPHVRKDDRGGSLRRIGAAGLHRKSRRPGLARGSHQEGSG